MGDQAKLEASRSRIGQMIKAAMRNMSLAGGLACYENFFQDKDKGAFNYHLKSADEKCASTAVEIATKSDNLGKGPAKLDRSGKIKINRSIVNDETRLDHAMLHEMMHVGGVKDLDSHAETVNLFAHDGDGNILSHEIYNKSSCQSLNRTSSRLSEDKDKFLPTMGPSSNCDSYAWCIRCMAEQKDLDGDGWVSCDDEL